MPLYQYTGSPDVFNEKGVYQKTIDESLRPQVEVVNTPRPGVKTEADYARLSGTDIPQATLSATSDSIRVKEAQDAMAKELDRINKEKELKNAELDKRIAEAKTSIIPTGIKLPVPTAEKDYTQLRADKGVNVLESDITGISNKIRTLEDEKAAAVKAVTGKTIAAPFVRGEQAAIETKANEQLNSLYRNKALMIDELAAKNSVIQNLMTLKGTDYKNTVDAYNSEFTNNVNIYNATRGIAQDMKSEEQAKVDNAKANAQIIINSMVSKGLSYNDLSDAGKAMLTRLGSESGLGSTIFSDIMKSSDKPILTHGTSKDGSQAWVIYKDGTKKTFDTGLPKQPEEPKVVGNTDTGFYEQSYDQKTQKWIYKKIIGATGMGNIVEKKPLDTNIITKYRLSPTTTKGEYNNVLTILNAVNAKNLGSPDEMGNQMNKWSLAAQALTAADINPATYDVLLADYFGGADAKQNKGLK